MNSGFKKIYNTVLSISHSSFYVPVRHRYYADKIKKGPLVRKFGYNDSIARRGLLPRLKDGKQLPGPEYIPKDHWTYERATFGQNDYIDILGGGILKPADIMYEVPKWLRGRKGNELTLLLLKQKKYSKTQYPIDHPTAWNNISKRIKYLYKYLNRKTKTGFQNQ